MAKGKNILSLTKRTCEVHDIKTRGEYHGDEIVTAVDVYLSGIMLDAADLNALCMSTLAHKALYLAVDGRLTEPHLKVIKSFPYAHTFEHSQVTLWVGLNAEQVTLDDVKLKAIVLLPTPGGLTALSVKVQSTPDIAKPLLELLKAMKRSASAKIRFGSIAEVEEGDEDKQGELPMDGSGEEGEAGEEKPDEPAKRKRGRPAKAKA